jgi:hypothetical protein
MTVFRINLHFSTDSYVCDETAQMSYGNPLAHTDRIRHQIHNNKNDIYIHTSCPATTQYALRVIHHTPTDQTDAAIHDDSNLQQGQILY